jgi:hypothetical protein
MTAASDRASEPERAPAFDHTPAEVRAAQSATSPFSLDEIRADDEPDEVGAPERRAAMTDEGLGLDAGHRDVDPEGDTGVLAPGPSIRSRLPRRPQAERVR